MTENEWQLWFRKFAIDDVEIGAANGAGVYPEQQLSGRGFRLGYIAQDQRSLWPLQNHRAHVDLITRAVVTAQSGQVGLRLQFFNLIGASLIEDESPSPADEGLHVVQQSEPQQKLPYPMTPEERPISEVIEETPPAVGNYILLLLGILFGVALLGAGVVFWIESRPNPVIVAISPPDERDRDPLGSRGALVPVSPDLLHVTSIALGNQHLTIVNGKRLAEGDWLIVKTPQGEASVRVISIQDGFVRFKHGGNTLDARLQMANATPTPH
jgi:hypothetical protein